MLFLQESQNHKAEKTKNHEISVWHNILLPLDMPASVPSTWLLLLSGFSMSDKVLSGWRENSLAIGHCFLNMWMINRLTSPYKNEHSKKKNLSMAAHLMVSILSYQDQTFSAWAFPYLIAVRVHEAIHIQPGECFDFFPPPVLLHCSPCAKSQR